MTRKATDDPELQAKILIADTIDGPDLTAAARGRVVRWVTDRWADDAEPPRASWAGGAHRELPFDAGRDGRGVGVEP